MRVRWPKLSTEQAFGSYFPSGRWARLPLAVALVASSLLAAGCRQDMHDNPRFDPLEKTTLFANGTSAREPVKGTVARGHLRADTAYYSGKAADGKWLAQLPMPVDAALLKRGQVQYNVFCSPCHSQVGDGNGMIVRRGYKQAGNFHDDRLRTTGVGYFYDVITNGFGQMPAYASQIKPADRWAIVAYVRVLQFSQNARLADLPGDAQQALATAPPVEAVGGPQPGAGWGGFGNEVNR
jgi:mono/diheme cytochrome c family protein